MIRRIPYTATLVCSLLIVSAVMAAYALGGGFTDQPQKRQFPRDGIYYEITNDVNDHGNYWETYHVPVVTRDLNGREITRTVYCVVYSDQIGNGGGAGPSCNWDAFNRGLPGDKPAPGKYK